MNVKKLKIDQTDRRILLELMKDSRVPVAVLAKRLHISREVCNYRISRLTKEGVIRHWVTEIDLSQMGYIGAALFVNIRRSKAAEFEQYVQNSPRLSWVAELSGPWNYGLSIYAKDAQGLDHQFRKLYEQFKDDVLDYRFLLHKSTDYYYERYFGAEPAKGRGRAVGARKLDHTDRRLLEELSNHSRMGSVELAKKIGITPQTVSQRIRRLEKEGCIRRYSILVDLSKLGLYQYSLFMSTPDADSVRKLARYLAAHEKVSFVAQYIGSPLLEFGAVVSNPYELRDVLQAVGEASPNTRLVEMSLFQKEFVSVGPPKCVFE